MKIAFAILFLFSYSAQAEKVSLKSFSAWLSENEISFAKCSPKLNEDKILLCDGTSFQFSALKKMFQMSEKKLIETLRAQGVKVSVLCETSKNKKAPFAAFCTESFDEKLFKKTKSLHGRYLPEKKTILIRSSASKGSLIHEYLHYLQSENKNPIYGKVYKNTRNRLQKKLTSVMDEEIRFIENAKKTGEGAKEAPKHLQRFMQALEGMRSFSKWQDLIDERGLFLLYINFGKQLGVPQEDIDFAKKNMGFICRRKDLKGLLPAHQCS